MTALDHGTGVDTAAALHRCKRCQPQPWGNTWELGSAAFWTHLTSQAGTPRNRLADTLDSELVACVLGGFGVPGDVGVAAYEALRESGVLTSAMSTDQRAAAISQVLGQ